MSLESENIVNLTITEANNDISVNPNAPITNVTNNNIFVGDPNSISTGNADLRYYPLNSNPSGYQNLQIGIPSGYIEFSNGNATTSWVSPVSPKWCILREDFIGGTNSDGQRGELGWRGFSVGGGIATFSYLDTSLEISHNGCISLTTPAITNAGGSLALAGSSIASINSFNLKGWDSYFVFKIPQVTTSIRFRLGFSKDVQGGAGAESPEAIWLRYDKDASYADTGYYFVCRNASINQQVPIGIAPDTDWHTLRIWCENTGYINYSFDSLTGYVSNISNNRAKLPHMILLASTNNSVTSWLDYFGFMGYCGR